MDLETLYQKVREECSPLPECVPYNTLREAYSDILEYDLKKASSQLQNAAKQKGVDTESFLQLDNLIADGMQRKQNFEQLLPNFKIQTENGKMLCQCIEDRIVKYKNILEEKITKEYKFFESEKGNLKNFCDSGSNNLAQDSRAKLDKISKVCVFLENLCDRNNIPVNTQNRDNINHYFESRKKAENLKEILTHISGMRAEIKWNYDYFILLKKKYNDYMEKLPSACEEAEYYEGAAEAKVLEQDLRELIGNWGYLSEKNKRLNKDLTDLAGVLNVLQNKEPDIAFFKELTQKKFTAQAWYEDLRKYTPEVVSSYIKFLNLYESLKKSKASELAKKLCAAGDAKAVLESQNLGELESAKKNAESFAKDAASLAHFADTSQYQKLLENNAAAISVRINYVQKENERQHELSKKKIEADERLGRDELGRKYDFEKQAEEFRKKEEMYERRLQENEARSESLARSMKDEKEDKKAKEKTIDALIDNIGKTLQVGKESMDDLGKELSANLYKKFCDQLERELKRVEESISAYGSNTNVLAGKINAFQSDLTAIRTELSEIRKDRGQMQVGINESLLLEKISHMITDSLEKIVTKSRDIPKQPSLDYVQANELDRLKEENASLRTNQMKKEYNYNILFSVESLSWPDEMDLVSVKRKLDGDGEYRYNGMLNRVLAIKDDFMHAKASNSIFTHEWVKKLRSIIKEDLDHGLIAHYVSCGGYAREQFYEVLGAIDGFIKRSEPLVQTKLASLSAMN